MDIYEFASGLRHTVPNGEDSLREKRLHHAISGIEDSPYLRQASSTSLAGRAFEDYYWHLLPKLFRTPNLSFAKHCLLNFAVQQLAIRSLYHQKQNRYLYIGESAHDLGASLLSAPHFLQVTWVRKEEGVNEAYGALLQLLSHAREDDVRGVGLLTNSPDNPFKDRPAKSCGLIVLEFTSWTSTIDSFIEQGLQTISPGGTLLILFSGEVPSVHLNPPNVFSIKLPSDPETPPHYALIVRGAA